MMEKMTDNPDMMKKMMQKMHDKGIMDKNSMMKGHEMMDKKKKGKSDNPNQQGFISISIGKPVIHSGFPVLLTLKTHKL